jgi:hypothetical protein
VLEAFVFLLAVMAMANTSIAFVLSADAPSLVSKMGNMLKNMFVYLFLFWVECHFFILKKYALKLLEGSKILNFSFFQFFLLGFKKASPKSGLSNFLLFLFGFQ